MRILVCPYYASARGEAAEQAAVSKSTKYSTLPATHDFIRGGLRITRPHNSTGWSSCRSWATVTERRPPRDDLTISTVVDMHQTAL